MTRDFMDELGLGEGKGDPNPMVRVWGYGNPEYRCKNCQFFLCEPYHDKTYYKCEKRGVTHGEGTDHRLKWKTCGKFLLNPLSLFKQKTVIDETRNTKTLREGLEDMGSRITDDRSD